MNRPYVKQYNKNGVLINPIVRSLVPDFPNRRKRRMYEQGEKTARGGYVKQIVPVPFPQELTPKGRLKKAGMPSPIWKNRRQYKNIKKIIMY